jgi:hypothetical protein
MDTPNWIAEFAAQERERRAKRAIAIEAIKEFGSAFSEQIDRDLNAYAQQFPDEYGNLSRGESEGYSYVQRLACAGSRYNFVCQARTRTSVDTMTVHCEFQHTPKLNKQFPLTLDENGKTGLVQGSIADLSRYFLMPVVFDRLIPRDSPDPLEFDTSSDELD